MTGKYKNRWLRTLLSGAICFYVLYLGRRSGPPIILMLCFKEIELKTSH